MFRIAFNLASKVKFVDVRPSFRFVDVKPSKISIYNVSTGLSWSRNYASQDLQLGPQGKLSQNPQFLQFLQEVRFLSSVSTSPLLEDENPTCEMHENGTKYIPVMREALCFGGRKALEAGVNHMDLDNGIQLAFEAVNKHLHCRARTVSNTEEIFQIGTTAANGDPKIGELVAETYKKIGGNGFYIIDDKKKSNNVEFVTGMKLNWGISSIFINDESETLVLKNPFVLIHENEISNKNVVKQAIKATGYIRPLLIVAENIDKHVAASLLLDRVCQYTKVCVVIPPDFKENIETTKHDLENKKGIMQDPAILMGGRVVTSASSLTFIPQMLGSCKAVTLSCDDMAIHGGKGHLDGIMIRSKQLRSAIESSSSDYEINLLTERYDRLGAGAAIFKVGKSKKANVGVTNALTAFKAALEEGIVPGGGIALFHASKELDHLQTISSGEKIGVKLLQHALKMPLYTIASTLGFEGSAVVEKLMEQENPDLGYDLVRGEYVDMVKAGIVDPLKLVRRELEEAIRHFGSHSCCSSELGSRKGAHRWNGHTTDKIC